jgi:hypothetical protein
VGYKPKSGWKGNKMTKKKASKKAEPKIEAVEEVDIFEGVELEESQEEDPAEEVVVEAPKDLGGREKRLVGHDPVTKEPVYI